VRTVACLVLGMAIAASLAIAQAPEYDLVIRGGRVVDGTGNPAFHADVAIRAGRIAAIGRLAGQGKEEIDARGLVVAPGFIDVHTHAEGIANQPRVENFVRLGITSIVTGNCGGSALDVAAFFQRLQENPLAVNVATLIGHNTVRSEAMGGAFDRPPSPEEQVRMRALVEQAMRDGAVGLSTGLIYLPGTFARTEEILDLATVAARFDGIYASHMRNEGSEIDRALDELFRIAREAGIRAEISHIKLSGRPNWGRAAEILRKIEAARADGLDVTQDQYAYTASSTSLSTLIPASAREGGLARFRERIADPETKRRIVEQMKAALRARQEPNYAYAVIAGYGHDATLNGKNIVEATRLKRNSDSLDDQIELILEIHANGGASAVFHGMSEEDVRTFMAHPNTMIASDGGPREIRPESFPHPRSFGNNARVLGHYVRDLGLLRLEDAIRKMTSLPATQFRLRDRGLVREGYAADLVLFDPRTVRDEATFAAPQRYPVGILHVIVNGVPVLRNGEHTDARPGVPLRHRAPAVARLLSPVTHLAGAPRLR